MRQSVPLGRVAGVPVGANWSVFVILLLIADALAGSVLPRAEPGQPIALYWAIAVPAAALFLASLLAHEIAHAIVARRSGVKVRSITLWMLGGVAQLDGEPATARADLLIAAAGPLTSLVAGAVLGLAGVGAGAAGAPALLVAPLLWTGAMNAFIAVFNLLPGAPLDGGRVLRALVWMRRGDRARADRAATRAGRYLGAAIMGAGLAELVLWTQPSGLWLILVGWFLLWSSGMEAKSELLREATAGLRVGDLMLREPDCAAGWRPVGEFAATVAAHSRQSAFPVVSVDGEPVGVVTLDRLARVAAGAGDERVDALAVPLPDGYLATPDDPAESLLGRPPLAGGVLAVVVEHRRVAGMVTSDDLGRLARQTGLRRRVAPSAAD